MKIVCRVTGLNSAQVANILESAYKTILSDILPLVTENHRTFIRTVAGSTTTGKTLLTDLSYITTLQANKVNMTFYVSDKSLAAIYELGWQAFSMIPGFTAAALRRPGGKLILPLVEGYRGNWNPEKCKFRTFVPSKLKTKWQHPGYKGMQIFKQPEFINMVASLLEKLFGKYLIGLEIL